MLRAVFSARSLTWNVRIPQAAKEIIYNAADREYLENTGPKAHIILDHQGDCYRFSGQTNDLKCEINSAEWITEKGESLRPFFDYEKEQLSEQLHRYSNLLFTDVEQARLAGERSIATIFGEKWAVCDKISSGQRELVSYGGPNFYMSCEIENGKAKPYYATWEQDGQVLKQFSQDEMKALKTGLNCGLFYEGKMAKENLIPYSKQEHSDLLRLGADTPYLRHKLASEQSISSRTIEIDGKSYQTDNSFKVLRTSNGIEVDDGFRCSVDGFFNGIKKGYTPIFDFSSENGQRVREALGNGMHR